MCFAVGEQIRKERRAGPAIYMILSDQNLFIPHICNIDTQGQSIFERHCFLDKDALFRILLTPFVWYTIARACQLFVSNKGHIFVVYQQRTEAEFQFLKDLL